MSGSVRTSLRRSMTGDPAGAVRRLACATGSDRRSRAGRHEAGRRGVARRIQRGRVAAMPLRPALDARPRIAASCSDRPARWRCPHDELRTRRPSACARPLATRTALGRRRSRDASSDRRAALENRGTALTPTTRGRSSSSASRGVARGVHPDPPGARSARQRRARGSHSVPFAPSDPGGARSRSDRAAWELSGSRGVGEPPDADV